MRIYSIKNEKLGFFNRPIYCENDVEALSYIQNVLMSDADRALLGLKGDLALYFVGSWDSKEGKIYSVIDDDNNFVVTNHKVCDLEEIFATIPEDKIPRSERQIADTFKTVFASLDKLSKSLDTIKVDKKGNVTHD